MKRWRVQQVLWSIFFACVLTACSAGGPGDSTATPAVPATPSIQVLPSTYDFGKVTTATTTTNTPAPLEITVRNNGTAPLHVSAISLPADSIFFLDTHTGVKACGTTAPTVAAADHCTVQVAFRPPPGTGTYSTNLQIRSDDRNTPLVGLRIDGASEPVSSLLVRINQLEGACASDNAAAYVSVTDQGGYPVTGLITDSFSAAEGNVAQPVFSSTYVDVSYEPLAISAVMDYSGSLTGQPVAFADMKNGFSSLVSGMRAQDIGQVVKFETTVEVVQPFTSDKAALQAAIDAPFGNSGFTRLYDAAYKAVEDTALNTTYRRAVILATDGKDEGPTAPYSNRSLDDVIQLAASKNVAIFTIGIGGSINRAVLEKLATDTGGLFYAANTSQNLATIYQQLSSIVYREQYLLTVGKTPGSSVALTIGATLQTAEGTLSGSATSTRTTPCN